MNANLDIIKLRNKTNIEATEELFRVSEFIDAYYFKRRIGEHEYYSYIELLSDFKSKDKILREIWSERELYFYCILDANKKLLFEGNYTSVCKAFNDLHYQRSDSVLYITGYKVKDKKEGPTITECCGCDYRKVEKLEADMAEIKELLKKMVV